MVLQTPNASKAPEQLLSAADTNPLQPCHYNPQAKSKFGAFHTVCVMAIPSSKQLKSHMFPSLALIRIALDCRLNEVRRPDHRHQILRRQTILIPWPPWPWLQIRRKPMEMSSETCCQPNRTPRRATKTAIFIILYLLARDFGSLTGHTRLGREKGMQPPCMAKSIVTFHWRPTGQPQNPFMQLS